MLKNLSKSTILINIDQVLFGLSLFTLSQSIKLSSKLFFLAVIVTLIKSIIKKDFSWFKFQKPLTFFCSAFVGYVILNGLIQEGFEQFFRAFERDYAPYLLFLIVPSFFTDYKKVNLVPKAFIFGVLFTIMSTLVVSVFNSHLLNRSEIHSIFSIHHLYFSIYILFTINYLLTQLINSKKNRFFILTLLLGLVLFLVHLKSKAAIVILGIILLFRFIVFIVKSKKLIILMSGIAISAIIIFNKFFLKVYLQAIDFRSRIWSASIDIIKRQPLFGYGNTKEHYLLNKEHYINANYDFLDSHLNSHNQYLTFLISMGTIGLILFLVCVFTPLKGMKDSIKREYIGFLIIFLSMFSIESYFNRHHGIVFCIVFLYYYNSVKIFNSEAK